jgi:asparagine synthase (glutamine-hydrolysing)
VACGLVLGDDAKASSLGVTRRVDPRAAIEAAILRALLQPPCLVSFSGGRDSSAVLAVATAVARREGLALPVPATFRFALAPGSHEDDWQEHVVRHLALRDWERLPMTAELDSVGPVAQDVLMRHGLVWPSNAHFHVPLLRRAAGGSLLTGIGGDEVLGSQPWASARAVLARRYQLRGAHVLPVAVALSPRPVRRWAVARRHEMRWPWLRPDVQRAVEGRLADWQSRTPISWRGAVAWWWRSRYRAVLSASMALLATDAGTQAVHPFLEEGVVGAVAGRFGAIGPDSRSAAMRALFEDVLPAAVMDRRSKAFFNGAFISDYSRSFAASWTGEGVDDSLVDPVALAKEWCAQQPDPRSMLLMQSAWLARR